MGMLKEFKEFAVKGNLVDIAVAFVMGAAFGKIVTAFIDGIVMPLVTLITGGVNFNNKQWILREADPAVKESTAVAIKYGVFITNLIDFIVVAFCMFLVIKAINRMKRTEPVVVAAPEPSATDKLLMEIRDELRKN
ncbi:MAG: large-conductance mechanosensitive channel protein MscL [Bacteroidota bacterium]